MNGHCLFLSHRLFSGTSVFCLLLVLRDHLYLSCSRFAISYSLSSVLIVLPLVFVGLRLLDILLKLSLLDQSLHLIFQMPTLISMMPVVLVEPTILAIVYSFYWSANWLQPLRDGSSFICIRTCSIDIIGV